MLTPGGPGGKYLGRSGPVDPAELREMLADVHDQLKREPAVLDSLEQAILTRDLTTSTEILIHLRDFFMLLETMMRSVRVGDRPRPAA